HRALLWAAHPNVFAFREARKKRSHRHGAAATATWRWRRPRAGRYEFASSWAAKSAPSLTTSSPTRRPERTCTSPSTCAPTSTGRDSRRPYSVRTSTRKCCPSESSACEGTTVRRSPGGAFSVTRANMAGLSRRSALGTVQRTGTVRVASSITSPTAATLPGNSCGYASTRTATACPGWRSGSCRSGTRTITRTRERSETTTSGSALSALASMPTRALRSTTVPASRARRDRRREARGALLVELDRAVQVGEARALDLGHGCELQERELRGAEAALRRGRRRLDRLLPAAGRQGRQRDEEDATKSHGDTSSAAARVTSKAAVFRSRSAARCSRSVCT